MTWTTWADWDKTGNPISSFKTTWVVPAPPLTNSGQYVALFQGLMSPDAKRLLQPVLQWGVSDGRGGSYWSVVCYYIENGNAIKKSTNVLQVGPSSTLVGVITLIGNTANKFTYSCSFQGYGAATNIQTDPIDELTKCCVTMECMNANDRSYYPSDISTRVTGINILAGGVPPPQICWNLNNDPANYPQHSGVVNNSSTNGEVDLFYDKTLPDPPINLTFPIILDSKIDLNWEIANEGGSPITGYNIERSSDGGVTWSTLAANYVPVIPFLYSDFAVSPATTYWYRVSAINALGTSSPSDTSSATTIDKVCYLASEVFSYFNKPETHELEYLLTNFMDGYMQETEERKTVVRLYELIVPKIKKKLHEDPRKHEIFQIADRLITKGYESAKAGDYDRTYQLYTRALLYSMVYYLTPQYLKLINSKVKLDLPKFESDLNLLLK